MNVGIVGCGRVTGLRHLPALRRVEDARVVALADVDAERLGRLGAEHGVERRYERHEDLVADTDVEAVAVCVPVSLHADVVVGALGAGKHVLVEKPLALTRDDAARIAEAARGAPGTLAVALNLRHHRLVRRARALAAGLGTLQAVRTVFTSSFDYRPTAQPWRFRRELGGGALVEMGAHHLDLWRFLTGCEVVEVFAASRSEADEDETVVVTGVLERGVLAQTLVSQRSTNVNELELFGERGRVSVDCYRYDGLDLQLGRGFRGDVRRRLRSLARAAADLPELARGIRRGSDYVESYAEQWRRFLDAAAGSAPPEPDVVDGVRNVEVVAAALESLETGRSTEVRRAPAELTA